MYYHYRDYYSMRVLFLYCILFMIVVYNFHTTSTAFAFTIIRYSNINNKIKFISSKTTATTTTTTTTSSTTLLLSSNQQKQRINRYISYNSLSLFSFSRNQNEDTTTVLESRIEDDTRTSVIENVETNNESVSLASSTFLGYNDSDNTSKGIVSSLTNFVNSISLLFNNNNHKNDIISTSTSTTIPIPQQQSPPQTVNELMERIRIEYTEHNYLWTGNIDISSFDTNCQFIDPTLSFTGIDTYRTNVQNLQPLLSNVISNITSPNCQSILQDIQLYDNDNSQSTSSSTLSSYIETKWIMYGQLDKLFYKPIINVTGRTKFWYKIIPTDTSTNGSNNKNNQALQVYLYDEKWEIPAYQALLQLITPQW